MLLYNIVRVLVVCLLLGACKRAASFGTHGGKERAFLETRRNVLAFFVSTTSAATLLPPTRSHAAWWEPESRRQKELCLVTVLRVSYWAERVSATLRQNDITRDRAYLEARLGAKALLTGKVGGGANAQVYTLSTLQLRGCLADLEFYKDKSRLFSQQTTDLLEAIASLVEFDGLDNLQDPSPRSSLTLAKATPEKIVFVQRLLSERIVPLSKVIVEQFDSQVRARCDEYIMQYYSNELPSPVKNSDPPITA